MSADLTIGIDGSYAGKVTYAVEQLTDALEKRYRVEQVDDVEEAAIVVGTPGSSTVVGDLASTGDLPIPDALESLAVGHVDGTLYVAGRDEQGLLYAILEVAEQVELRDRRVEEVEGCAESPDTEYRGIYTFLHNEDCEREWFHSDEHWEAYFDLLARSRFNSFQLVMGSQTNYLAPPFPFFVDVEEHPEVSVPSLTDEQRQQNGERLDYVSTLAEERGLDFVLGIWQVIVWGSTVMDPQESMVEGLDRDNLASYTYHGVKTVLKACPAIKGIELRANAESGVPMDEQTAFFTDTVFRAIEDCDREVYLDLRGWYTHEETIEAAKEMDFPLRLSMKHWAEHLGGPAPATEQSPAYSYADFLRYPRDVPVAYQVWTLGSHRIFVWGDPDHTRTFAEGVALGDSVGFEVCPPLTQKGYGNEPGAWRLLQPEYEYYEWEFERYWLFYTLFGRLTYDSGANPEVWMRRAEARYGDVAAAVMDAYATASKILSFVIRFNMNDPNMYLFPETDMAGVLDFYLDVQPSDPARIASFRESVEERLTGEASAKLGPAGAAEFLRTLGRDCLDQVDDLREHREGNAELHATLVDFESLAELALYHADKTEAALALALFYETGDFASLSRAGEHLEAATPHWKRLTEVAGALYNDELVTGPVDNLTWEEKRPLVEEDVERIREQYALHRRYGSFVRGFDFGGTREFDTRELFWYLNRTWEAEKPWLHDYYVERGFTGVDEHARMDRLGEYGWTETDGLTSTTAPLVRLVDKHLDTVRLDTGARTGWEDLAPYGNQLYVDYVSGTEPATFVATLPPGEYEVTVILADRGPDPAEHGPLSVSVDGEEVVSGVTVPAGEVVDLRTTAEVDADRIEVAFEADDGGDWIATGLVIRPTEPIVSHTPPGVVDADKEAEIVASVTCPEPVEAVTLLVRGQDGTIRRRKMEPGDDDPLYRTVVPDDLLGPSSPVSYWFEAVAGDGSTTRFPDSTVEEPAFELLATAGDGAPVVHHEPVRRCAPGEDVPIDVTVESGTPIERVRLYYRYANQYYDYRTVEMAKTLERGPDGLETVYAAEIPGKYVVPEWDVLYYVEAVDATGAGTFSPAPEPSPHPVTGIPYNVIDVDR